MGKGSSPRNNHSKEWYANYDDINWNANPRVLGLSDEQIDCFELACKELTSRGIKLTRENENDLIDAIEKDTEK